MMLHVRKRKVVKMIKLLTLTHKSEIILKIIIKICKSLLHASGTRGREVETYKVLYKKI